MSLFERPAFEQFIAGLPAVEIVHQWGEASVGKVGGKIFALLSGWSGDGTLRINFKCSDLSFEMLPELEGVEPAKYLARAKWVQVTAASELSEDDITVYIIEAHRLVAAKLPRSTRDALGLAVTA